MEKYERIDLTGTVSLDIPFGGTHVSGEIAKTSEGLSICPGRVDPRNAIKEAQEHGGYVLLSDQLYFQDHFIGLWGRRDFVEGRVRVIKDNKTKYAFRPKGSRHWTTLRYSTLQELLIKKD